MKPNLFIIGAAKSGTTSLHNYLSCHQDICMSQPKEPKYFSYITGNNNFEGPGDDEVLESIAKSEEEYNKAFAMYSGEIIVGESSADYLYYHKSVIPKLLDDGYKDAKIIIILRNPFERAKSAYNHLVRDKRETLTFTEALKAEPFRIDSGWEFIWHYRNASYYYCAVKSYIDNFESVKVVIFDDMVKDLKKVMGEIFEFLGVDEIEVNNIKYNDSEIIRYPTLNRLINSSNFVKLNIARALKVILGKDQVAALKKIIIDGNLKKRDVGYSEEISKFKVSLNDEVNKLERLLNTDLSEWKARL